jgi:hypothetical protein
MTEELAIKYGKLVQFGVDYMIGFNSFADLFVIKYNEFKAEIMEFGYSDDRRKWVTQNKNEIIQLYDDLNSSGLIPTEPI